MKKCLPLFALAISFLMCGCFAPDYEKCEPLPGEILSTHATVARYDGLILRPCHFMTADCPNDCDHAGIYAIFTMVDYVDYQKPGQYGDEKQLEFFLRIADKNDNPDPLVAPELREEIDDLEKGDIVELDWAHVYITDEHGAYPERIVTRFNK